MNWLKDRRIELNMSQADLAKKLQLQGVDITPGSISHWENNRNKPPIDDPVFRKKLATVLNLSVTELLIIAGYEMPSNSDTFAERAKSIVLQLKGQEKKELAVGILEKILMAED